MPISKCLSRIALSVSRLDLVMSLAIPPRRCLYSEAMPKRRSFCRETTRVSLSFWSKWTLVLHRKLNSRWARKFGVSKVAFVYHRLDFRQFCEDLRLSVSVLTVKHSASCLMDNKSKDQTMINATARTVHKQNEAIMRSQGGGGQ